MNCLARFDDAGKASFAVVSLVPRWTTRAPVAINYILRCLQSMRSSLICGPSPAWIPVLMVLAGCGSTRPTVSGAPDLTIAQKLAVLDDVPQFDPRVERYSLLLRQLSAAHTEGERQIADMTVTATQLLAKDGIAESNLHVMEAVNQLVSAFPAGIPNQSYAGHAVLYVQQRRSKSHRQAVETLLSIVKALGPPK